MLENSNGMKWIWRRMAKDCHTLINNHQYDNLTNRTVEYNILYVDEDQ